MIVGIGTDIVKVDRFKHWIDNPAMLQRYFHPEEIQWCLSQGDGAAASFAVRFAAREAFGKALGTGLAGFPLDSVFVRRDDNGKPTLILGDQAGEALKKIGGSAVHISLSHERDYATAMVVIE